MATVLIGENERRLMIELGRTIQAYTTISPMALDSIVGVLAFCAGSAITQGVSKGRNSRRALREMAVANIDRGMDAQRQAQGEQASNAIMPANFG